MITLKREDYSILLAEAEKFDEQRIKCKDFLTAHKLNYDKFTMVSHDAFIGFITEEIISDYISTTFQGSVIQKWNEQYDPHRISEILLKKEVSTDDIDYIKNYFYDKWDLKVTYNNQNYFIDIKTALTQLDAKENWDFMYPVVQAKKPGKDLMILCYYVTTNKDYKSLKEIVLVGYITELVISACKEIKAGEKTKFGTTSQIDNYVTNLGKHYSPLTNLFK